MSSAVAEAEQPPQLSTNSNPPQELLSVANSWLASNFSNGAVPSMSQFDAWFESIAANLPDEVTSTPRAQLYQTLIATPNQITSPSIQEQGGVRNGKHAKFQRTDQWQPVYSWLESLNKDEVVRSEDIAEWLEKNSCIKEELSAKHSRYHLMHYIKKCHFKILKRRDMKRGLLGTNKGASEKTRKRKDIPAREPLQSSPAPMMNVPKNDDLLIAKRDEAAQKFEILVEFEKQLIAHFPNSVLRSA